jgi:hypothetical protein
MAGCGTGRGVKRVGSVKRAGTIPAAVKPTNNSLLAFDDWFIWENTHIIRSLTIFVRVKIAGLTQPLARLPSSRHKTRAKNAISDDKVDTVKCGNGFLHVETTETTLLLTLYILT